MKKASTLLIQCIIFFTLLFSCKKDKLTQNGANTFSCKINGSTFKPCKNQLITDPALYGGVSISSIAIARVTANCYSDFPKKSVSIELSDFHGVGEYSLSNSNNRGTYTERNATFPLVKTYESLYQGIGKVIITKDDRTNYILSGTFEFVAANIDSLNDVVTVADGRFDISYK